MAGAAAALFDEPNALDAHAAFDRFDHVIDGETGDGYRGQRFHLDAGLARHLDPRSRITQSSGVSGSASTFAALPLIVNDMDIPFLSRDSHVVIYAVDPRCIGRLPQI